MNQRLFDIIEGPKFSAQVNVVSGYSQFLRALALQPVVRELLEQVQSHVDALAVLFRMVALVAEPADPDYETPYDAALAAYLWVLSKRNPQLAHTAAGLVHQCAGCWWARKFGDRLLEEARKRAEMQSTQIVGSPTNPGRMMTISAADATTYVGFGGGGTRGDGERNTLLDASLGRKPRRNESAVSQVVFGERFGGRVARNQSTTDQIVELSEAVA